MGGFTDVVKILFLPALFAGALYLLLAYLILPLLRTHRARYNQYLPLDSLSSTSHSLRSRASNFFSRLAQPPERDSSDDLFGDEEGESMVGFDYRDREREVRGGRVESLWSDARLSRELEEGFKDDSEDEEEETRRGRG
ncbi:hypothetical protein Q7P37_010950 [Cladosporium fusiforme]